MATPDDSTAETETHADAPQTDGRSRSVLPLLIAGVTLLTFLAALRCGFVNWDDDRNIIDNPAFRGFELDRLEWMFTTFHGGHYQPLTWLSFALDYRIWGLHPIGYHLTNILFHAVGAVLFYGLALRMLRLTSDRDRLDRVAKPGHDAGGAGAFPTSGVLAWSAAFAALVFAVHPLRVESVVWVTERRDVLSGVFFFACVLMYLRAVAAGRGAWRWHVLAWMCMLGSLAAKAAAMTLPVVMLILDVYPIGRLRAGVGTWRRLLIEKIPYFVLSIVAGVAAMAAQQQAGAWRPLASFGLLERVATACYSVCFYPVKWVAPHDLSPMYPLPAPTEWLSLRFAAAAAGTMILVVMAWGGRRRWPGVCAAMVAYLVLLAPISGVAQSGKHLVADRYSYLALLPFALLAGGAMMRLLRRDAVASIQRRRLVAGLAGLLVIGLALLTIQQSLFWSDSESLWRQARRVHPESSIAAVNLADAIWDDRKSPEALALYQQAVRLDPLDARAHNGLGIVLLASGEAAGALRAFETAVWLKPQESGYRANLGYTLAGFGRYVEAATAYARALELDPRDAGAANALGSLLGRLGRYAEARQALEAGLGHSPSDAALAGSLAWLLATCPDDGVRDGASAVTLARELASRTEYTDPWVLDTLAAAYAAAGDFRQAVRSADIAIELARERGALDLEVQLAERRRRYAAGRDYRDPKMGAAAEESH